MNSVIRQLLAVISVAGAFRTVQIAAVPVVLSQQLLSWWVSSAVDAKGVRHQTKDHPKGHAPWMADVTKQIAPEYSKLDQAHRVGGFGLYRVVVDLKTGSVRKVSVIQSTGVATLDASAMKALGQWVWKPGKWKEVDVPIAFMPFSR
ncbi:MAG TPA: TonB family protein [Candidatus Udaeobacter sp.]|jgi:TonB family protein